MRNKRFLVTYVENKKYRPATVNVEVETTDQHNAEMLVHDVYGSLKRNKEGFIVPSEKIKIIKTIELKENIKEEKGE